MRLSEAIRAGHKGLRQSYTEYERTRVRDGRIVTVGVCALGSANRAMNRAMASENKIWPWADTHQENLQCAVEGCTDGARGVTVFDLIVHLNDEHHWTFDQIADEVQVLEAINGVEQGALSSGDTKTPARAKVPADAS